MKLTDLEFIKLLPEFMRDDSAVRGLAAGFDAIIPEVARSIEKLTTWDRIDELSEAELDELAWELNISWYNASASIEVKRDLIKNSDMVHKTLGTKAAVENVIQSYFGDGEVVEWFDYDGTPGHFQVHTGNPTISNKSMEDFLRILEHVKRASAKLDSVVINLSGQIEMSAGIALHTVGAVRYTIR